MSQAVTDANNALILDSMANRYLICTIGDTSYALEIEYVTEIVEMMATTDVPGVPYYMNGIINLRGTIIPVMDARCRFGYERAEYNERTCIVVLNNSGVLIGLVVDAVQEVTDIMPESITPPPKSQEVRSADFIKSIGRNKDSVQLIVDCTKI